MKNLKLQFKIKRYLLVLLVLVLIGGGFAGGYFYGLNKSKKEKMPTTFQGIQDKVLIFLENLEKETKIDFSEIKDIEFSWMPGRTDKQNVKGKMFQATKKVESPWEEGLWEISRKIKIYFQNNGFEEIYSTEGTAVGSRGYKKDNMVCIVIGRVTEGWTRDTETIKCGILK